MLSPARANYLHVYIRVYAQQCQSAANHIYECEVGHEQILVYGNAKRVSLTNC